MKNYKVGDFVRLVEEDAEGYITAILDNDLIAVTGKDGFEIPVPASKVTLVYGKMGSDDDVEAPATIHVGNFEVSGVFLAITGDQKQGLVEFHLVNQSSYQLLVSMNTVKADKVKGEYIGIVEPDNSEIIYRSNVSTIGTWPTFNFQFIFHSTTEQAAKQPYSVEKKIRAADLSAAKETVERLGKKAWVFQLDKDGELLDVDKLKEHFISHRPKRKI